MRYNDDWEYILADESREQDPVSKAQRTVSELLEWAICFLIAYILYLFINYFVGTISGVRQKSMYPTVVQGEEVVIQRPTIFKKDLNYGDIITFEAPNESLYTDYDNFEKTSELAIYSEHTGFDWFCYNFMGIGKTNYIKRVIGLPGDNIVISDDGYVYRNGQKLEEPYLNDGITNKDENKYVDLIVPEDSVYVLGDNRLESKDSRYFGCIPESKITGYVLFRIWPLSRFGGID